MRDGKWLELSAEKRLQGVYNTCFWLYCMWAIPMGILLWMLTTNRINWYTLIPMVPFGILSILISGCYKLIDELKIEMKH